MPLHVHPRPLGTPRRPSATESSAEAQARLDDTAPEAFVGVPLDVEELEDTLPSFAAPDFDESFSEAPTQPDMSVHFHTAMDDRHWERVLRAVAEAVRRVFESRDDAARHNVSLRQPRPMKHA